MRTTLIVPMRYKNRKISRYAAFTLVEMVVAITVLALFLTVAMPNFFSMLGKRTFRGQLQDFISTMQRAATAAAQSRERYEVIIDLDRQSYMLREISSNNLAQVREDEIIIQGEFGQECWVSYVLFDDGAQTNEGRAKFRAGHAGWQYGGKIVFLDQEGQPYSVMVNRMNGVVELKEGDAFIMWPRREQDVSF